MIDEDTQSSIEMIRQSALGIVSPDDLGRVRALRHIEPGFDRSVWQAMCDLGWPALRVAEDHGGVGLGLLPYCALAEELGRGLVPEPLIPAMIATDLLRGGARERQMTGEMLILPAWCDQREVLMPEKPLAVTDGRLTATKHYVPSAEGADAYLVLGADRVALVAADAPGVTVLSSSLQDGGFSATVRFDSAPCTEWKANATPALAEAALATGAYLLGVMQAALAMTVAYLKEREQFGRKISNFQSLQHLAVDMALEVEVTRASIEQAAVQWDINGPDVDTYAGISRAKSRASGSAMKVTRDAIQLHGGIGFTDEHDIGLFLRKAMVEAARFGGAKHHRANYARLKPLSEEA